MEHSQLSGPMAELRRINASGSLMPDTRDTLIGRGVELKGDRKIYMEYEEMPIRIPDVDRSGHLGCFGTTRVGKTRLIENIVEQDIRKGYNVVVIDPKGDIELFSKMIQVACESGRLDDIMFLTPIFADYSNMLDPLAHYYMEDELVDHVVSGIKAKEDYFIAIATEVTQAIVTSLALIARSQGENKLNINFNDVKNHSDFFSLRKLKDHLQALNVPSNDIIQTIDQIISSPQDFFSKVSSSMRTTLSALTSGSTGKIIGKSKVNEFVTRFEEGRGVILFCNTGSMLARRTAHIIGRVLVSMIQSMIGRFFASGKKLDPPLCLHIDEGHNCLYMGIEELFSKGGGANAWVSFYTQSFALMEQEIGREGARSILDNINTWIYMLVNHPETAAYIEDSTPMAKKYQPVLSLGGGISVREVEEKLIMAPKLLQLAKRQFYMRSYGRLYKGATVDVTPRYVTVEFPSLIASVSD